MKEADDQSEEEDDEDIASALKAEEAADRKKAELFMPVRTGTFICPISWCSNLSANELPQLLLF